MNIKIATLCIYAFKPVALIEFRFKVAIGNEHFRVRQLLKLQQ
jgi:hypothetical protein